MTMLKQSSDPRRREQKRTVPFRAVQSTLPWQNIFFALTLEECFESFTLSTRFFLYELACVKMSMNFNAFDRITMYISLLYTTTMNTEWMKEEKLSTKYSIDRWIDAKIYVSCGHQISQTRLFYDWCYTFIGVAMTILCSIIIWECLSHNFWMRPKISRAEFLICCHKINTYTD